jgi:hypothetical protein
MDSLSLSPTRGKLKHRLDHDTRIHMPMPPVTPSAICQLHRWAHKVTHPATKENENNFKPRGCRSHVMHCEACGVHLCLDCWAIFHKEKSLKLRVFDILGQKGN